MVTTKLLNVPAAELKSRSAPFYRGVQNGRAGMLAAPTNYVVGAYNHQGFANPAAGNGAVYYRLAPYKEPGGSREGVIIRMRGPIARFARDGTATTAGVWLTYNLPASTANGTLAQAAAFGINPYDCVPRSSPAAAMMETYTRFQFRKLKFEMEGLMAANQASCYAMVYIADGAGAVADSSYASSVVQPYFKNFPFWVDGSFDLTSCLSTKDWFYTDQDEAVVDASERQCFQGVLLLYPNSNLTSATNQDCGILYIEAELVMIDANPYGQDLAFATKKFAHQALLSKLGEHQLPLKAQGQVPRSKPERKTELGVVEPPPELVHCSSSEAAKAAKAEKIDKIKKLVSQLYDSGSELTQLA